MGRKRTNANAKTNQPVSKLADDQDISAKTDEAIATSSDDADVPDRSPDHPDEARVVDAVVDRRELDVDHPEPIHPMAVVGKQLAQTGDQGAFSTDREAIAVTATEVGNNESVSVEAIALESDDPILSEKFDKVADNPAETMLSGPVVEELSVAIATVHQHEAELEAHLTAIEQQQQQLQEQFTLSQAEIARLKQQLTETHKQETALKQQVTTLRTECDRTTSQLSQCRDQLAQQPVIQQELNHLKTRITDLTTELEEAKRCILQLTQTRPSPSRIQRNTPPLSQRSPNILPQKLPSHHPAKSLVGLPPMSTERLGSTGQQSQFHDQRISRTSERLRPAYTRPGFTDRTSDSLPQNRQPLPQLQAPAPRQIALSQQQSSPQSAQSSAQSSSSAMVSRQQASLTSRRSRSFDDIHPELKSSQLPKPKVSDTEIGWFD